MRCCTTLAILVCGTGASGSPPDRPAGGEYGVNWQAVNTGGALHAVGAQYVARGTVGQAAIDGLTGGGYQVTGGFWVAAMSGISPPARPLPDDAIDISGTTRSCMTAEECLAGLTPYSEVACIPAPDGASSPGTCYVRRNRYVSIRANPDNAGIATARRIKLSTGQTLGWIGQPLQVDPAGPEAGPQWLSRIEDVPYYMDWSGIGTLHVGDCETVPDAIYHIQAIASGADEGNEARYSESLILGTVRAFGDVVGGTIGTPPDNIWNFKDISSVVRGFQSTQTEPKVWLDLQGGIATPEVPNFTDINFADINWAVAGFQGGSYPFAAPCDCPGQGCR